MSSTIVQRRGGTTIEHSTFIGADREITVDTVKHTAVVHDGTTPGGYPLAKESDVSDLVTLLNNKQSKDLNLTSILALTGNSGVLKKTSQYVWTLDNTVYAPNSHVGSNGMAHTNVTSTTAGFMSNTDKIKLDGITAGANNYTLPNASSTTFGGVKINSTTQVVPVNTPSIATGKTYAVQNDSNNQLVVNVPWSDTDTVYTHPTSGVTAGTYRSVTVNSVGHVTAGTNPTTLVGYGITDAYNKTEIETLLQGLKTKESVLAATTTNIVLSGIQTIDGVILTVGSRVLVKDQTIGSKNGIYIVASGTWTRSLDADTAVKLSAAYVFVERGTSNADTGWVLITDFITIDDTNLTWSKTSGAGSYASISHVGSTGNAHGIATTTVAGFMSNTDKTKLDGIAAGANNYVKPANEPISYITGLQTALDNKASTTALNNKVDISAVQTGLAGYITSNGGGTLYSPIIGMKEISIDISVSNTIDISEGNLFYSIIGQPVTISIAGMSTNLVGSAVISFILELTNGGSNTITWWNGIKWPNGIAPKLTTSGKDVLGFYTYDNGNTWIGMLLAKDVK